MEYSIKQLADLAGTTVRTLHYYDQIGLLKPLGIKENGYRYYSDKEIERLQQILFFKELEFSLDEIINIITTPNYDHKKVLNEQKKLLQMKKEKLEKLIETIDNLSNNKKMKNQEKLKPFQNYEYEEYREEAKKRWGNTDAYKQSMERVKKWTKEDFEKFKKDGKLWNEKLASLMNKEVSDPEVQEMVKQHHKSIELFYDCSLDLYQQLGEMYVTDPRFTKYYDKTKQGLAKFLKEAIDYYCTH